jgi:hypothetical protein
VEEEEEKDDDDQSTFFLSFVLSLSVFAILWFSVAKIVSFHSINWKKKTKREMERKEEKKREP